MSKRRAVRRPILVGTLSLLLMAAMGATASAQPPSNDDRGAATVIGALPFLDSLDTREATPQVNDPLCANDPAVNPTVWYSFTPAETDRYGISVVGSDYPATLVVGTPNNGGIDIIVDCAFDTAFLPQAQAGQTYLIMVGSCCEEPASQLVFRLRRDPPRPRVQVSIASRGIVNEHGGAVVHGRVECTNAGGAGERSVRVNARQPFGRFIIRGSGNGQLRCDGPWRARARGQYGIFAPGAASVVVRARVCGAWGCGRDEARRIVTLREP